MQQKHPFALRTFPLPFKVVEGRGSPRCVSTKQYGYHLKPRPMGEVARGCVTERGVFSNPLTRSCGSSPKGRAFFVHAPLSASCHEYVSLVGADVLDSPFHVRTTRLGYPPFRGRGGACSSRSMFTPHHTATIERLPLEGKLASLLD